LGSIDVTVLDEADHMADLGFLPAVRRPLKQTPRTGQRLLFSVTLDDAIDALARHFLTNPAILMDLTSAAGRTVRQERPKGVPSKSHFRSDCDKQAAVAA